MRVDKFDYNAQKTKVLETINKLFEDKTISNNSFNFGRGIAIHKYDDETAIKYINVVKSHLLKNGINLDKFFNDFKSDIYTDPDFTMINGFMDFLLYYYDNQKGILSGYKLIDSEYYEIYFKYYYGFFNYDLGKKFILQSYNNLEEYYEDTANKFLFALIEQFGFDSEKFSIDTLSIVKKYNKGYTIYVNFKLMFAEFKQYMSARNRKKIDDKIMELLDKIPHRLFDGVLEIYIGYKKNPISYQEFKEIKNDLDIKEQAKNFNL